MAVGELVTEEHVLDVTARMRVADRQEVLASGGFTPEQALRESLKVSVLARTLRIAGEVAAIFGVALIDEGAVPWALTTTTVDRHPREFWRASVEILAELRRAFPMVMVQRVDARYDAALRWLERLGFTVGPAEPWGRYELPFHLVTMGGPPCASQQP